MNKEKVISQVNQIINMLEKEDIDRIPKNVVRFFNEKAINKEEYMLNPNIPLKDQRLLDETLDILVYIYSYIK